MQDYTQSAELICANMQKLRKRCAVMSGNQRCELTGQNVLGKEFYLFRAHMLFTLVHCAKKCINTSIVPATHCEAAYSETERALH